tara:strand:- start:8 stop:628 length:621 start_codon:yes stop_codon:yes gene_type:complete
MPKKCPPGVICIENMTILFIFTIILFGIFVVYKLDPKRETNDIELNNGIKSERNIENILYNRQNTQYSKERNNVFMNPYAPPLRKNPFYNPTQRVDVRESIPINMQTSYRDTEYTQVGFLTRSNGSEMILPLFGRPLHSNRNKWQYYTFTGNNNIKLPVNNAGKNCTGRNGCDELFTKDNVYVDGHKDAFDVVIYENNDLTYIPLI